MATQAEAAEALELLTLAPGDPSIQDLGPDDQAVIDQARPWITGPNVVGTGVSFKTAAGTNTGEIALRVYVARKLDDASVPPDQAIPPQVDVPGVSGLLPTDVVEIGTPQLQGASSPALPIPPEDLPSILTTEQRPLLPGYSVGVSEETGTIGCFVASTDAPQVPLMLSNCHVLAGSGAAPVGAPVMQPGPADGGGTTTVVGSLLRFVPLDFTAAWNNLCDAAVASIADGIDVSNAIPEIGQPTGVSSVNIGDTVFKSGRTTGYSAGIVWDPLFRTKITYPSGGLAWFYNQVLCSLYTASGDSGSIVCDAQGQVVGLHWMGTQTTSVFSPITSVFQQLGVQLWAAQENVDASPIVLNETLVTSAIDRYSEMLMSLPGVQGLGVSEPTADGRGWAMAVYLDTAQHESGIPDHVDIEVNGADVPVPLVPTVIGTGSLQ